MTARRSWLMRVGALALGIALAAGLAEVVVRVTQVAPEGMLTKRRLQRIGNPRLRYHCYPTNPTGEFSPPPDVSDGQWRLIRETVPMQEISLDLLPESPWCVEYRRTHQQFRDREYVVEPAPGVTRVIGIGDSFAIGEGVPLEKTLFKQLENLLGDTYEVVNAGVPGFDTHKETALLLQIVSGLKASVALVVFVPNDVQLTQELFERQRFINDLIVVREENVDGETPRGWLRHSRLFGWIASTLETRRITAETIRWYHDMYDGEQNRDGLRQLADDFRTMAATPDCKVALVIYPLMESLDSGYPLTEIHETVAAIAREAGLPVLDLAPAFQGENARRLHVHPTDHHPNGRAHAIAARAIADWMQQQALR